MVGARIDGVFMSEETILNRIWEELKALREDLRASDAKHSEVSARVIALEQDRVLRDRSRTTWITVGCAFGTLAVVSIGSLIGIVLDTRAQVGQIDRFGTTYGRDRGTTNEARLDKESRRNDAQDNAIAELRTKERPK